MSWFRIMSISGLIYWLFTIPAQSQEKIVSIDDTISVGEIVVVPAVPDGAKGFKAISLDKDLMRSFAANSISSILNSGTPLYIKSYGAGGLSTSSFRGMGANHTQIVWEGLRVDNQMTGQTDLSTFFAGFIDNITLYNGGSPSGFANRGPGGTVSIESDLDWSEGTDIQYLQNVGSFSLFSESIKIQTGTPNIQYSLRAIVQKAKNDYGYYDIFNGSGEDVLRRTGASYASRGMLHELDLKSVNTVYSAKLWYSHSNRDLPGSIEYQSTDGNEHQTDESIRSLISVTHYKSKGEVTGKIAYVSDWLEYNNIQFDIDSRNLVNTINGTLHGKYLFSESTSISLGLDGRYTGVNTNNYENAIDRNQISVEASMSKVILDRVGLYVSLNQEILDNKLLSLSPSLGLDVSLVEDHDYHIKGNIGRSNHLPTLNDLYWLPGGNPDLKTETAGNVELTFSFRDNLFRILQISSSITAYYSSIDNMIVWLPESGFVWSPQNILKVRSRGIEIDNVIDYRIENHVFKLFYSYYFTDVSRQNSLGADDQSAGKQLVYVPKSMASVSFLYGYNDFRVSWRSSYTGIRYTTDDNSESLSSYWLSDLSIKYQFSLESVSFDAGLSCNNLFNVDYQNVVNYPMPWRSFTLSLSFKFGNR
jgi:outer membrane cobalamin receptor